MGKANHGARLRVRRPSSCLTEIRSRHARVGGSVRSCVGGRASFNRGPTPVTPSFANDMVHSDSERLGFARCKSLRPVGMITNMKASAIGSISMTAQ